MPLGPDLTLDNPPPDLQYLIHPVVKSSKRVLPAGDP
jgi:hypothetical protein